LAVCLTGNVSSQENKRPLTDRYELHTDYYQNGTLKSQTVAHCTVRAVDSAGVNWMQIKWTSQIVITGQDTLDQSADATSVAPYRISLDPKGSLHLPKLEVASMTGAITDFNTFFVPLHPKSGYHRLIKKADAFTSDQPVKGNFANGKTILKGEDCILISSKLVSVKDGLKTIQTSFLPPQTSCLTYYHTDMQTPVVADTINNIQMIMASNAAGYMVQYGRERFTITATLHAKTSSLVQAFMTNDLRMKLKLQCDSSGQNCATEMPWHIYRELRLKKL
jgi:hypothetical protein